MDQIILCQQIERNRCNVKYNKIERKYEDE